MHLTPCLSALRVAVRVIAPVIVAVQVHFTPAAPGQRHHASSEVPKGGVEVGARPRWHGGSAPARCHGCAMVRSGRVASQ